MLKKNIIAIIGLVTVTLLINGCAKQIKFKIGRDTDISLLESRLIIGSSTREDVIAVLGVPHGKGRVMLPVDEAPRTIWSYYYEEDTVFLAGGENLFDFQMLFIYFKGNVYDGHMKFSTFTKQ